MCDRCMPTMSRRRVLALAGAATAAAVLATPDRAAAQRAFRTGYGVDIQPRAVWAGDTRPYLGEPAVEEVRFLLVHHTAGPSDGDPIELMRDVYRFHTSADKGWPDVAYNFFIDRSGGVYEARAGSLAQAVEASATGGNQGFAQLVCLLGDFTAQNPTPAALTALNATLAWLADRHELDTSPTATADFESRGSNRWPAGTAVTASVISGHRDMSQTACPGDAFYPYLVENVQSQVDRLRANPALGTPTTISTTTTTSNTTTSTTSASTTVPPIESPPGSTQAPFPDEPAPASTEIVASSTSTPSSTSTAVPPETATTALETGRTVAPPPAPQADGAAVDAAPSGGPVSARSTSNSTAWALGAGATTVAVSAALYVGVRGRHRDAVPSTDNGIGHPDSRTD